MKTKLILLACISIAFASCKKDAAELAQPQSPTMSMDEQVADLIKRADKNLYEEVYNQNLERETPVTVTIIPGYFRIPDQGPNGGGNVDDGFCMAVNSMVCMVVVSPSAGASALPNGNLSADVNLQFTAADNVRLIANTASPVVENISGLSTSADDNGIIHVKITK